MFMYVHENKTKLNNQTIKFNHTKNSRQKKKQIQMHLQTFHLKLSSFILNKNYLATTLISFHLAHTKNKKNLKRE